MNNFIFKSANRLIKNSPITLEHLMYKLTMMQKQLRELRQDNVDMSRKLERLLIDKHLQMQVDEYFKDNTEPDSGDLD